MPYIRNADRHKDLVPLMVAREPGELNYQLTMLAKRYVQANGMNYMAINDVIGALEAAKLEFYRRVVVPYEDKKIAENGDVYDVVSD